jgi:uncharacterized membrane protein YqaE (UPF0057 family)
MRKLFLFLLATLLIAPSFNYSSAAVIVPVTTSSEPNPEAVKAAIAEFKSLSRKEKKAKLKELKKELFAQLKAKKEGKETDTNTILLVILAILLPPLAVYLHQGEINIKFWITLILWLLAFVAFIWVAWLPLLASIIYALFVVLGN